MSRYRIEFFTPLFSRGAYEDRPEVRPSSIRGQLHWWFRALGGRFEDEKTIFGSVHKGATASRIVVRVSNVEGSTGKFAALSHKQGGQANPRMAYAPGTAFSLHVLRRLAPLTSAQHATFQRSLEAWLLLGTLGLRSTRAGGSFHWATDGEDGPAYPTSFDGYETRCRSVLQSAPLKFAMLKQPYDDAEHARRVVSDTLGGRDDMAGQSDLGKLHDPLGKVFGGRKTSPLRFRIVGCEGRFRIAAVWDNRREVTGNSESDLRGVIKLLADRKPALGQQLAESSLA